MPDCVCGQQCGGQCRHDAQRAWCYRFGERLFRRELPLPMDCDGKCPIDPLHLKRSKLMIYHPCLVKPIAVVEDVATWTDCGLAIAVALDLDAIKKLIRPNCKNCGFKYRLSVTLCKSIEELMKAEKPDGVACETCEVVVASGDWSFDWSLVD